MLGSRDFWVGLIVGIAAPIVYHKFVSGGLGPPKA